MPGTNPKLQSFWEPGTIVERKTMSTFVVYRPERKRRKKSTMNVLQLKPRKVETPPPPPAQDPLPTPDDPAPAPSTRSGPVTRSQVRNTLVNAIDSFLDVAEVNGFPSNKWDMAEIWDLIAQGYTLGGAPRDRSHLAMPEITMIQRARPDISHRPLGLVPTPELQVLFRRRRRTSFKKF